MIDKKYIIFDLDGTLTDPFEGITKSLQLALKHFGIEENQEDLRKFIGPPFRDALMKNYGFDNEKVKLVVEKYRERFATKGVYENKVYNGIPELLKDLKDAGKTIMLATSKPIDFAEIIIKHFNLFDYFDFLAGSKMNGDRDKKSEVIAFALEQMGITDISQAVMIGDREHDVIGAQEFNMTSIGVLYGFGDRNELEKAGADYICETVEDIKKLILE